MVTETTKPVHPPGAAWRAARSAAGLTLLVHLLFLAVAGWHFVATGGQSFAIEDSWMYSDAATMLGEVGFAADADQFESAARERMPAFPTLLLGLGWLGLGLEWLVDLLGLGDWLSIPTTAMLVTAANLLLIATAAGLLAAVATVLSGQPRIGSIAGGLLGLFPGVLPYSLTHMPESMALAVQLLAVWLLVRAVGGERVNLPLAAAAGLVQGVATLTKPVHLYQEALVLVLAAALLWRRPDRGRSLAAVTAVHLVAFALPVGAWVARSYFLWGVPTLTPNIGVHLYLHTRPQLMEALGRPAYDKTHPLTAGRADDRVPRTKEEWAAKFGSSWDNLGRRTAVYAALAKEDILANKAVFAKLLLSRHPRLYAGTGVRPLAVVLGRQRETDELGSLSPTAHWEWLRRSGWLPVQVGLWLWLGLLYAAAAVALAGPLWRLPPPLTIWCLSNLAYLAAVTGTFNSTRYRFPLTPYIVTLAAVGVWSLARAARR